MEAGQALFEDLADRDRHFIGVEVPVEHSYCLGTRWLTVLLKPEEEKALVDKLILHGRSLLSQKGERKRDPETGFEHVEYKAAEFVLIEHQRQQLPGGEVKTNGLDVWWIAPEMKAKKVLSVNYLPFKIKVFHKFGKAAWIEALLQIG